MNLELAELQDGSIMLTSDRPMPDIVDHVEFFIDQRLMMIVYCNAENEDRLLECEISHDLFRAAHENPEILIFNLFADHDPIGYKVPLVNVG
jgi:hypothetical protein